MGGVLIQLAAVGISMGMIYALLSMGVILLVRAVGVTNFAQGDILAFGAYISVALFMDMELPLIVAVFCEILLLAIFAAIFMFTVYWPLRNASWPAVIIISTLGASIIIRESAKFIWGKIPRSMPPILKGAIEIGNARLDYQYLIIFALGLAAIFGVLALFEKSYAGRMMQGAAQDSYAAKLIGIPTMLTTLATFIISFCLAGLGGYLVGPLFLVTTTLSSLQLKAFAGIVIGGFGNIKGAVIGSVLVGLIEAYSTLFTSTYKDTVVFAVLIVFLVARPQGIYGERISDKA